MNKTIVLPYKDWLSFLEENAEIISETSGLPINDEYARYDHGYIDESKLKQNCINLGFVFKD